VRPHSTIPTPSRPVDAALTAFAAGLARLIADSRPVSNSAEQALDLRAYIPLSVPMGTPIESVNGCIETTCGEKR